MKVRTGVAAALLVGAVVGAFLAGNFSSPAFSRADERGASGGPHYSVVETQAHNLIVTDNTTNTVYFYTIDKDKEIGSALRLRGTLDLAQVGKAVMTPKHHKMEK